MTIRIFSPSTIISLLFLTSQIQISHQFSERTIEFSISEDAPINTIIGTLHPEDGYSYRLSRGNSKIKFDDQTLEFSISAPLDRESEDIIDMLVVSSPPSIIHVLIHIEDVNDNPPKFPLETQKVEIPETAPSGWRVQIQGATDPDAGKNGTIGKYELTEMLVTVDAMTPFRVVRTDGFVYLEVVGKLDREMRDFYSMKLTATDMGTPELSSSCLLNIIILDINDNPPDFGIRSITLNWNGLPNSKLFHLNATDADSGDNGKLNYRIQGAASEMFGIEENSNNLVTKENTECSPSCEFVIEARDSGVPPLTTTLNVVVRMEYGNEHEPNINIRFYPSDFPFIVVQPEDVNGKTLAILSITDSDGPLGENSTIWIEEGNEKSIFSLISRQSINILTLKNLEFAEKEQYNLQFAANDGQLPHERISKKSLKIFFKKLIKSTVIDVAKEIHVDLERDTVPGSFVAHVETNCSEMCSFELQNSDVFKIDESNGIIVTSSELPPDVSSYHLPIKIHPPPPSTQILETDVFVKILQDSAPRNLIRSSDPTTVVHLKRAYTFSTWQNVTVGTVVGRLPRAQVYSTVDRESELGVFPDGSIFVGKSISVDLVTLPVTLKNRNATQTSIVTLLIKPLNLHVPICKTSKIQIREDSKPGDVVGRLHAEDQDSGVNGILVYKILENSENFGVFHVDSETGNLRILEKLDAEKRQNYTITYEARDLGTPSKSTNCTTHVYIEDVNDNAPKFSSRFYTAKISGNSNETVAIVSADDEDVASENRKIQYRLLNLHDYFRIDEDSGKVTTIQNLQKTFGKRINVSIEAVNVDSNVLLYSRTFLLVTVVNSTELKVHLNSEDVVRIFKNDEIGAKVGKIDVTASEPVIWKSEDSGFWVDASGDIRLLERKNVKNFNVIVTSSESGESLKLKLKVEFSDTERNEDVEKVEEVFLKQNSSKIMDLSSESSKTWKIRKTISEDVTSSESQNSFFIEDRVLYRSENSTSDAYVILETDDDDGEFRILHVIQNQKQNPSGKDSESGFCTSSVHLITPPATIPFFENCEDVSLQNPKNLQNPIQIHEQTLLVPQQSEVVAHIDLISKKLQKPFMMTLIKDEQSEDVKFLTSNVLMLLSSVHQIGTSFGRVTAESGYRVRYYLVGTDQISIDADTGELFLKERFYRNLNDITIVAVIPKGIAKAKVTIEVIEDRLVLPKTNFFIVSPKTIKSDSPIGSIQIGRDDVLIDVIDDDFYVRDSVVFAKRHFTPSEIFHVLSGVVKKGKLSAPINVTLFFGNGMDQKNLKENELIFEVEENSPIGTVVGVVPNAPTSKYRLVDPSCGLEIDKNGILKTTTVFDHEKSTLLKTKMIEFAENQIWDILLFIGDVNDNAPKILNAPGKIIIPKSENFEYQLIWEDSDDVASEFRFFVVDGDPFGVLEVSDYGVIKVQKASVSFNATIRVLDNRPPFKVNSDDVTIEFIVDKESQKVSCEESEFFVTSSEKIGKMKSNQKVTWRIVPSSNSGHFHIDPMSGEIQKTSSSRLRKDEIVNLKIQAISYDAEDSTFCNAKIQVLEETGIQKAWKFEKSKFEFSILETTDRFTEVGRVNIVKNQNSTDSEDPNVIFRILHNDFNFTISPFDGRIFTNSPLDYEGVKEYNLTILATSTSSEDSETCNVIIKVIDENDEAPRFITGDVVNLYVKEEENGVPYPMVIGSSIAEDMDEGGVVTYSILSGNTSMFAVNETTGDILSLGPLDREDSAHYELIIEAKDSGFPSLSATSRILIHVEDVNDNAPEFEHPSYFVKIPENLPIGSKILRIQAKDRDVDSNLQYSLEEDSPFRIDVATGWITVVGKVDREENSEFLITIGVSDGLKSSRAVLEVQVEDVNDNWPVIQNQNLDVYVSEDVTSSERIHVIEVNDLDSNDHLKFYINDTTFKISTLGEILTTSESRYPSSVRITVTDDVGHVANSEYRFYQVPKKSFPIFTEKMDTVTVREHETQELAVFKARAKGEVRYSMVSRCKEHLEMESVSGILKTRPTLDREQFSECPVFIIATTFVDNKPLQDITKIDIKILDINDNSPKFDKQFYEFNVTENSGPTIIGNIIARDLDSDAKNARIFYEIVSGDPSHEFMITENGQIESVRDLDRETTSEYHLILEAFDDGKPRRRGNTTVVIRVLDEDDNAPRFSRIFHVEIPEDVKVGEEIIQLSASDSDEKSNHKFELDSGGERIPFRVEEGTGKVFVNETLDFEEKSSYRIKVRLTDGAWLIETSLFVNVKDVNDNFPIFEKSEYFFFAKKNSSEIGQVSATDLDSGQNGKIRYSVTSPYFRIHPDSGVLTKLRPLPEDVTILEVVAMDHGVPRLQKTVKVFVVEEEEFRVRKFEKLRDTAKPEDVVGEGYSMKAVVFPRGTATVTRDGNLILKTSPSKFWVLEDSTMTSYVVVKDSDSSKSGNQIFENLRFNISSSTPSGTVIHQILYSKCQEAESQAFRISKNGSIIFMGSQNTTSNFNVICHDDVWPIQNPKTFNVTVRIQKTSEDVTMFSRRQEYKKVMQFSRSTITILPQKDVPPCPVFPRNFYFFENPAKFEIYDFGIDSEILKSSSCRMEVESQNQDPLFHTNGSTVISLRRLPPGTFQFSLILKDRFSKVRSRCHVVVTVPLTTVPAHQTLPTVVFVGAKNEGGAPLFNLPSGWKNNDGNFIVADSGAVRSRQNLKDGKIYHLGVKNQKTSTSSETEILRIFVDEEAESLTSNFTSPESSERLQNEAVTLKIFSKKSGIPKLLEDLRHAYSDMKIQILATSQISEDVKYEVVIAIVDRNGVVVEASESQKTLTSFFKKRKLEYLEFLGFKEDPCDDVRCFQKDARCQRILEKSKIIGKCQCQGQCTSEDQIFQKIQKDDVTSSKTCEDVDCGESGVCFMENSTLPICRCQDSKSAFESLYSCSKADDVFSTSSEGGGHLEISMKNSTKNFKCGDECDGGKIQKIEFDFRTVQMKTSEILRVDFGKQMAIIELISGSIHFSISDEFTRPIQTHIEKRVNDGRWHRLLLQMSDDGKRISIQIDGRGKEVKSRVPLPMLFTSRRIQMTLTPEFCFRRLLAQNQFLHPLYSKNSFFNVISTSSISDSCQFDPTSTTGFLSNFSNTTTWILLSILGFITVIALSVCLLAIRRRWWLQKTSTSYGESSGWKKATEIDAFAVPRRVGHVNRSMVRSPDDDTYDVAGGYGTQMKSTSTDDMSHIYTSSASRRYQPPVKPYRRDGHINMAYL